MIPVRSQNVDSIPTPSKGHLLDGQQPVVIAVTDVPVVQSPIDKMINVIAVRQLLMLAVLVVTVTIDRSADRWIRLVHCQYVFVVVVVVGRVEMPIVQVVVVVTMRDAQMTA